MNDQLEAYWLIGKVKIMIRRISVSLFSLAFLTMAVQQNCVQAQGPPLGGLVESRNYYNGYGVGQYGAYGADYRSFSAYDFGYSGYGNGPYGAGGGSERQFLSDHRYAHGDEKRYDGNGYNAYDEPPRPQRYNPYGYGVSRYHHNW